MTRFKENYFLDFFVFEKMFFMKNPFNKKHISIFEIFFNQKKEKINKKKTKDKQKEMKISILIT